jgi:hypothetical protein
MPEINSNPTCKYVAVSRADTCAPGERRGLWRLSAEYARLKDADFVVFAGGLWSGQAIRDQLIFLRKQLAFVNAQLRPHAAEAKRLEKRREALKGKLSARGKKRLLAEKAGEARKEVASIDERLPAVERLKKLLEAERAAILAEIDRYTPENLAKDMAADFPEFTDASGKPIKVYVVPSKAYDHDIGILAARALGHELRKKGVVVLSRNAARIPLWNGKRNLEVLVPAKRKLPGKYHSTGPESEIAKKRQQTASRKRIHAQLLGCYGVAIAKPKGEYSIPYVTAGMLSRIEEEGMTFAENQVCIRLVEQSMDRAELLVTTLSVKDLVSEERKLIGSPGELTDERRKILDVIREEGSCSTGEIADRAKLSRKVVEETLRGMVVDRDRNKSWSGLHYHEGSDRWDFRLDWVKKNLRYPLPNGDRKVDSILAWGCIHGGAKDVDYVHFRTQAPRVALERNVTVMVGAGDFIEGLKHNLDKRGAIMAGFENLTKQETFVGNLQAAVILDVFRPRFERALAGVGKTVSAAQVAEMILGALVQFVYIAGNHDLWAKDSGIEPLVTMRDKMVNYLSRAIERILIEKGLPKPDYLRDLIDSKFVQVKDPVGETSLPSGLKMAVAHPHMSRTKTTSIRIQELMERSPDTQVLISANFHVAEHLEMWEPEIGQRVGIQVGTIKRDSHFEAGKLKTVDQGFAWVQVESVEAKDVEGKKTRRVVESTATFYSNGGVDMTKLDPEKAYKDFHKDLGIGLS